MLARSSVPSRMRIWDTQWIKPPTEISKGDSWGEGGFESVEEERDGWVPVAVLGWEQVRGMKFQSLPYFSKLLCTSSCSPNAHGEVNPQGTRAGMWQKQRTGTLKSPFKERLVAQLRGVWFAGNILLLISSSVPQHLSRGHALFGWPQPMTGWDCDTRVQQFLLTTGLV